MSTIGQKGTMCFAQYSDLMETELRIALGDEYSFQADWHKRWKQIIRGSKTVQFKYAWLHDQYAEVVDGTQHLWSPYW